MVVDVPFLAESAYRIRYSRKEFANFALTVSLFARPLTCGDVIWKRSRRRKSEDLRWRGIMVHLSKLVLGGLLHARLAFL
jgi:hypothetical protein